MFEQWYISREGHQHGPYTWDEFFFYAREGNIRPDDLVWSPSTGEWVPAGQVPGLLPAFSAGRSPTAPPPGRKKTIAFIAGGALLMVFLVVVALPFLGQEQPDLTGDEPPFWESPEFASFMQGLDDPDWQNYSDLIEEKAAIAMTLDGFVQALKQGDPDSSVQYIFDERQAAYRELFSSNPEAMESFGEVMSGAEISFLSEHSAYEPFNRTAEYTVTLDGSTFNIVFMKVEDTWVLYDF